jgi:hypothetical protein
MDKQYKTEKAGQNKQRVTMKFSVLYEIKLKSAINDDI